MLVCVKITQKVVFMKNVLITGSSSGFGKLTTETLLKKGYTVFATMRSITTSSAKTIHELKVLAKKCAGKLHIIELDVRDELSVINAIKTAYDLEGKIDVLINNAGVGSTGWTEAFPDKQVQKMFDINVFGVQRVMRAVLPAMRERKEGLIINLSSIQGRVVFPYSGIYTATKFAIEGFTESYHYELAPLGIDVVILQPGGFRTSFESVQSGPADTERLASYKDLEDAPNKVWGASGDSKDFLPHPQPVPDALVALIEAPQGKRPLRTTIDPLLGGEEPTVINQVSAKAQKSLSDKLGWEIF